MVDEHSVDEPVCVYGHFNRDAGFSINSLYPDIRQFICILRDPFDTALSYYFFMERKGKGLGRLDEYLSSTKLNQLSHFPEVVTEENYIDLIENRFIWIGTTETLATSMEIIADRLNRFVPTRLDRLNVSDRSVDEKRLDDYREVFQKNNPLEYKVYRYVAEKNEAYQRNASAGYSAPASPPSVSTDAKKITFHTGLPKAGTTSIQMALMDTEQQHRAEGLFFPFDKTFFGTNLPSDRRIDLPPQTDALAYLYHNFRPVSSSEFDWQKIFEDFLQSPDLDHAIISHELLSLESRNLRPGVFNVLARRAQLTFLLYLREPAIWLTSLYAQIIHDPSVPASTGRTFRPYARYIDKGFEGVVAPFIPHGRIDVRSYDRLTSENRLIEDFFEAVGAPGLAPISRAHLHNSRRAGRNSIVFLLSLKEVVPPDHIAKLFHKVLGPADRLDMTPRSLFSADMVQAVAQRWERDREYFREVHHVDLPPATPSEAGPAHLCVDEAYVAELREEVHDDLSELERTWFDLAARNAIGGWENSFS